MTLNSLSHSGFVCFCYLCAACLVRVNHPGLLRRTCNRVQLVVNTVFSNSPSTPAIPFNKERNLRRSADGLSQWLGAVAGRRADNAGYDGRKRDFSEKRCGWCRSGTQAGRAPVGPVDVNTQKSPGHRARESPSTSLSGDFYAMVNPAVTIGSMRLLPSGRPHATGCRYEPKKRCSCTRLQINYPTSEDSVKRTAPWPIRTAKTALAR